MGDRRKPRVFEGSYQGIALQGLPQMVLLEGPDATSQTALEVVGHEKGILVAVEIGFVTCHALVGQEMLQIMKAVACEMFMHFIIQSWAITACWGATLSCGLWGLVHGIHGYAR